MEGAYRIKLFFIFILFVKINGMDIFTTSVKPVPAAVTLYAWESILIPGLAMTNNVHCEGSSDPVMSVRYQSLD